MLVHSGASLHRHEYSPVVERSNSTPSRSPLSRTAALPSPIKRRSTIPDKPTPIIRTQRSRADSLQRSLEQSVRFQDEGLDIMDEEDGLSVTNSDTSDAVRSQRHRRRSSAPKSHYAFAYPPPTQLSKQRLLQIRPKKLLQLQHIPPGSRPMPVIDILPSTTFLPRLLKRYPRIFRGKAELGANDVLVVRSESYDTPDDKFDVDSESDDEKLSNRELLAVICQARKDSGGTLGKAEIVMADGSSWIASPLANDSFELVKTDEHGVQSTARWSRRSLKTKRVETLAEHEHSQEPEYTFSMIDPSTRRHPIIATLTRNNLKISDHYFPVNATPRTSAPSSPTRQKTRDLQGTDSLIEENTAIVVDDGLKVLVQVSSIWIGLRKGWCSYFTYSDTTPSSSIRSRVASSTACRNFSLSLAPNSVADAATRSGTPEPVKSPLAAVGDIVRRSCTIGTSQTPKSPQVSSPVPQRTVSSGSAFIQRTTAKRGHSYPSMVNGSVDDYTTDNWQHGGENHVVGESTTELRPRNGPTKTRRRPQSTILPTRGHHERTHRQEGHQPDGPATYDMKTIKKPKVGRWKAFLQIFKVTASRPHAS